MRYICKACKRKREEIHLKPVGKSKNKLNIWLCRFGDRSYTECSPTDYALILKKYSVDLDARAVRVDMIQSVKSEDQKSKDDEYIKDFAAKLGINL